MHSQSNFRFQANKDSQPNRQMMRYTLPQYKDDNKPKNEKINLSFSIKRLTCFEWSTAAQDFFWPDTTPPSDLTILYVVTTMSRLASLQKLHTDTQYRWVTWGMKYSWWWMFRLWHSALWLMETTECTKDHHNLQIIPWTILRAGQQSV